MDTDRLRAILAQFVQLCSERGGPQIERGVRYPMHDRSTLHGSPVGMELWRTDVGVELETLLVAHTTAASGPILPSPDFVRVEVYGRVASFVAAALASASIERFVSQWSDVLVNELTAPPVGLGQWLLAGPHLTSDSILFGDYLSIIAADESTVPQALLQEVDRGWATLPRQGAVLLQVRIPLPSRESPLPAGDAVFQAMSVEHDLELGIWFATGHRPLWLVRWLGEEATFRVSRPVHEARSPYDGGVLPLCPVLSPDPDHVYASFLLSRDRQWMGLDDDSFDEATAVSLRAAFFLADAADRSIEAAQLLVHTYGAIQGLVTFANDPDSKVLSRGAALLGSGPPERKLIRQRLDRIRTYRNAIAHGRRPTWDEAQAAAGLSLLDAWDLVDRGILERELVRQAREILRCALGSFLFLAAHSELIGGRTTSRPRLAKGEIVSLLDAATGKDDAARTVADGILAQHIPEWLRDPLGRIPGTTAFDGETP